MPDAREYLEYFYGHFFDGDSINYASPPDVDMALAIANDFRPKCIPEDRQNQAQAHYAAHILEFRKKVKDLNLSVSAAMTAVIAGPAVEVQEGSTRVKYSERAASNTNVAQIQASVIGPGTSYAAWFSLWALCIPGYVDPITGIVATKPGGIITRYGY
jgi:hypothetical protein